MKLSEVAAGVGVLAAAAYRVTRLVVKDDITAPIRDRLVQKWPPWSHKATELLSCPFCAGFWLSAAVLEAARALGIVPWPAKWDPVLVWAVAGVQALLNEADGLIALAEQALG